MSQQYHFQIALSPDDIKAYFELRQQIFCEEQALFKYSDHDKFDSIAYPIIAIATDEQGLRQIVGVVRIYESESELWYGGRLGVHADYRRVGQIGKGLIYQAVTIANTWGCRQFLATVQVQNVSFFRRLHWYSLKTLMICDQPHHLMEADLTYYPPTGQSRPLPRMIATGTIENNS